MVTMNLLMMDKAFLMIVYYDHVDENCCNISRSTDDMMPEGSC